VLVSPGTLAAVDVYVWLTYFQFSSVLSMKKAALTKKERKRISPSADRHLCELGAAL